MQYELRKQVIRAWKRGRNRKQISREIGLSYPAVCNIVNRYRASEASGVTALAPARRGRRAVEDRSLSAEQETLIQRLICEKRPEQLKMEFALWSRAAVMQLIERECGITLSVRGVGNYLKRWGFTPQKPHWSTPMCGVASPGLNPEEWLNAGPKQAIGSKAPARTKPKLKAVATAHMEILEQSPERVGKYFQDPCAKYAA